jgi:hypothetical protein
MSLLPLTPSVPPGAQSATPTTSSPLRGLSKVGSAFHLGYENVVGIDGMTQRFFGISVPKIRVLAMRLIAPRHGLFWLVSPPWAWFSAFCAWPRMVALAATAIPPGATC